MTNDKDSAVPDPASHPFGWEAKFVDHAWRVGMAGNLDTKHDASITVHDHYEDGHTAKEIAEFVAAQYNKALRQPTQSDALLEGDAQTILYLLGVRHGREDERAKIAAEASQLTQSDALREAVIEECANALEADAMKCDCAAVEERECGCGAWCEWKSITSARAVEIVRALVKETPFS